MDDPTSPRFNFGCDMDDDSANLWFLMPFAGLLLFAIAIVHSTNGALTMPINPGQITSTSEEQEFYITMTVTLSFKVKALTREDADAYAQTLLMPQLTLLVEDFDIVGDLLIEPMEGGE